VNSFVALEKDVDTYAEKDEVESCWKGIEFDVCENRALFKMIKKFNHRETFQTDMGFRYERGPVLSTARRHTMTAPR